MVFDRGVDAVDRGIAVPRAVVVDADGHAEFLDERLPNSRVVLIDGGHFIWEEAPAEYASIILDAINDS